MTRGLGRILAARETGILIALIAIVIVAATINPRFVTSADGWRDLLLTPSLVLLVAVGSAIVIITRSVDLSVGSVVGLTAYLTGRLFIDIPGIHPVLVFVAGVLLGAVLGLINGALVAFARVPALVITLGTMYIYRGINVSWAGSDRINASDLPSGFRALGTGSIGSGPFASIPYLTIIALIVLAAAAWYLRNLRGGRELYAIGSDPAATELYGLPVTRRIIIAFVASGALSGFAGVLYAARYGTVASNAGSGWELEAIGAAVIGGVAIAGGVGTVWGAAIGAFLLLTINRALPIIGIDDFWQQAVVGALILGAIVLDRVLAVRRHRQRIALREETR